MMEFLIFLPRERGRMILFRHYRDRLDLE
jgi:hypothetical protein